MEDISKKSKKGGRKPKDDRADYRYTVNLTEEENARFMALFRRSESKVISRFIAATRTSGTGNLSEKGCKDFLGSEDWAGTIVAH
jgi:hypothetical protein